MKLKYIIRRALVGVIIVPLTAFVWLIGYATLVGLGAEPTDTPQGVFNSGLVIGVMLTLMLMFWEGIEALFERFGL